VGIVSGQSIRSRVGSAIRELHHSVVGHQNDASTLSVLADDLERWVRSLQRGAPRSRPRESFAAVTKSSYDGQILNPGYEERPFSGMASPFAFGGEVVRRGDMLVTEISFGPAHEGAPGRVHGGMVAALFDDLTGYVTQLVGNLAFTGELRVRYEAPVPIGVKLTANAWLHDREGRKLFVDGELLQDGNRLALVEAIYITV
jgi:acyl-coenzyme A thioesterase PaaI-like protein